jgi:hypothetical protein
VIAYNVLAKRRGFSHVADRPSAAQRVTSVVRSGASYTIKIKGDLKWQN